ncbi:MAG TPA: hypothetical protein VEH77_17525, partial [Roseiarcus sp.]|nr:hypothetical protein [Roseiarcus sp.]
RIGQIRKTGHKTSHDPPPPSFDGGVESIRRSPAIASKHEPVDVKQFPNAIPLGPGALTLLATRHVTGYKAR